MSTGVRQLWFGWRLPPEQRVWLQSRILPYGGEVLWDHGTQLWDVWAACADVPPSCLRLVLLTAATEEELTLDQQTDLAQQVGLEVRSYVLPTLAAWRLLAANLRFALGYDTTVTPALRVPRVHFRDSPDPAGFPQPLPPSPRPTMAW